MTPEEQNARNMALLCHILGLLTSIVGVLILWLLTKEQHPFIDEHGKEALNFQITVLIYSVVSGLLTCIIIGIPLLIAVAVLDIVCCILAALAASRGEPYRYPLNIRFVQ